MKIIYKCTLKQCAIKSKLLPVGWKHILPYTTELTQPQDEWETSSCATWRGHSISRLWYPWGIAVVTLLLPFNISFFNIFTQVIHCYSCLGEFEPHHHSQGTCGGKARLISSQPQQNCLLLFQLSNSNISHRSMFVVQTNGQCRKAVQTAR